MKVVAAVALFAVTFSAAIQTHASKTDLVTVAAHRQSKDPTIVIPQGTAEIVELSGPVVDIMVADPSIVEVSALQANKLYMVGRNLGSTNMLAVDEGGNVIKRMNIHVTIDTDNIERVIHELFPAEDVSIKVLRGQVILTGSVSTPEVAGKIQGLVNHHITEIEGTSATAEEMLVNMMTVRGKAQVSLRVRVLEVSRTLLKEKGAETDIADLGGLFGDNVRVNPEIGIFGGVLNTGVTEDPYAVFGLLESFGAFGPVDTVISLLEDAGLAKVLAEPNLSAISGEQASFLAGGQYPVPSGRDNDGNIIITFQNFGVSLAFQPVVLSEDRIVLQLSTEVSAISRENQVRLADIEVPGLDIRRASTTVEMGSGTSLMIAGLIQSETFDTMSGIPGIMSTPVLGELFRSDSFRRQETEMVVLVTPYVVEPFSEKRDAQKIERPKENHALAEAFSRNIHRTYGKLKVTELFDGEPVFGYLID